MQELELKQEAEIEIRDLLGIGMSLVVLVIGLAYGLDVTGDVRDDMTENSAEYNATVDGITAVSKITEKLPTVAIVIMAAVIIGILIRYLWGAYSNNM
jgi:hypothetical protein